MGLPRCPCDVQGRPPVGLPSCPGDVQDPPPTHCVCLFPLTHFSILYRCTPPHTLCTGLAGMQLYHTTLDYYHLIRAYMYRVLARKRRKVGRRQRCSYQTITHLHRVQSTSALHLGTRGPLGVWEHAPPRVSCRFLG